MAEAPMNPYRKLVEKAFSDSIPLNAQFELTYRCNHLCTFCYNAPDRNREMTTPQIFDSLRKISEFGVLYMTLTGGEPLCHKDYFKIADETLRLGMALRIYSNGYLMADPAVAPAGSNETLTAASDGLGLTLGKSFGVKADLDLIYGMGNYTLTILTAKDGLKTLTLGLPTENYPATPQISNWSALQGAGTTASLTITWNSSRQGRAYADAIQLEIVDSADEVVYSTPDIGGLGVLTGQTTSVTIPANQLHPGQEYRCRLVFMKFSSQNTSYPGAKGFGVYYRHTHFTFTTQLAPDHVHGPEHVVLREADADVPPPDAVAGLLVVLVPGAREEPVHPGPPRPRVPGRRWHVQPCVRELS